MKNLNSATIAKVAAIVVACPVFVVMLAPHAAWLIVLVASAGLDNLPDVSIPPGFGAVGTSLSYAFELVASGRGYVLACLVAVYAGLCLAACARSLRGNPARDVDGGILGSQSSVSSPRLLLKSCRAWGGEGAPVPGVSLGFVFGKALVFECVHAAICAPSGSGKTRGSVYLTADVLSFSGENSLMFTDPSLEIYATASECLRRRGYDVKLLDFENPRQGARYNPLKLVVDLHEAGDDAAAIDRANEIGSILFPEMGSENDVFARAAAGVFSAVAYVVATSPNVPDDRRNLSSVCDTIIAGTYGGDNGLLKEWLRSFGPGSAPVSMAATFLSSEGKMESSIAASVQDGLKPFGTPNMRWMTSASDLDVDGMLAARTATFLHTLGPSSQSNRIAALFLAQHWAETQRLGRRRGLRPFWVVADEFHSIPRFDLVHALEQGRKYGLHYVMYVQSFSGFDQYKTQKEDGKDAILANCDVQALYSTRSELDARYFEAIGGFRTVKAMSEGEQTGGAGRGGASRGLSEQKVPVWPAGSTISRSPAADGALVFQGAFGARKAGRYEVPVVDASRTFVARHFGTLGSREFEAESMNRVFDELEEHAAGLSLAVEGWCPDFGGGKDSGETPGDDPGVAADEFAAWDQWSS